MADPPTTADLEKQKALLEEGTKAQIDLNKATGDFTSIMSLAQEKLSVMNNALGQYGNSLKSIDRLTEGQSAAFLGLGNAVIKASTSMERFAGLDMRNVNTLSAPLEDLREMLGAGGTAAQEAVERIKGLEGAFVKAGGSSTKFKEALKAGAGVALQEIQTMFASADNALKMEAAIMKAGAQTGEFGKILDKTGGDLSKMNVLIGEQNEMFSKSMEATGSSREQMSHYMALMRQIPGALDSVVKSTSSTSGQTSLLTAAIKLAHGTGRDYDDIMKDLTQAYKDFNMTGEQALNFSSRFSQLSAGLGVQLEDIKTGLMGAADAFKNLTDGGENASKMTEGLSKLMANYVGGLKEAGMTGRHATEVFQGMAGAVSQMNVAQRAYLSAQAGGPGGLMGAARVEGMLRRGDTEGVMKMVEQTMKSQFGRIVTLKEAEESESAASMRQRQVMLLQQGPLGNMMKSPEDAGRFLEAMRAREEGKPLAMGGEEFKFGDALQKSMDTGTKLEEKSFSKFNSMDAHLQGIRMQLEVMNANLLQRALTAAPGATAKPLTPAEIKERESIRAGMRTATATGGRQAEEYQAEMKRKGMITTDRSLERQATLVKDMVNDLSALPTVFSAVVDSVKELRGAAQPTGVAKPTGAAGLQADIDVAKATDAKKTTPPTTPPPNMGDAAKAQIAQAQFSKQLATAQADVMRQNKPPTPGAVVAAAPKMTPAVKATPPDTGTTPAPPPPEVTVTGQGTTGRITVNVTVTENGQAAGVSPAAQ